MDQTLSPTAVDAVGHAAAVAGPTAIAGAIGHATAGARLASSAVFLDRDGVIIENREAYVRSWADVQFLPGAFEALRRLSRSAHTIVLVTNQSAVGRGLLALEEAVALHRRVIAEIAAHGGRVDAWYLCPHRPEQRCACRKPAPGMLRCAQKDLAVDLAQSYLVGDAVSDMDAARATGVRGILVLTGRGRHQVALLGRENAAACAVVPDLAAALEYIYIAQNPPFRAGQYVCPVL